MFTSSADVFRIRQAVADLLEVVHLHRSAVSRIGTSGADINSLERIVQNGGIIPDEKTRSYTSILLAAAMPDEDFNSFIASTAILLADRLQSGGGEEDLYWSYEAFQDHYLLADAPVRAAIMNAFRIGYLTGKTTLPNVPEDSHCLTRRKVDVLNTLRTEDAGTTADFIEGNPTPVDAAVFWTDRSNGCVAFADLVAARFLYERPSSMAPDQPDHIKSIAWA